VVHTASAAPPCSQRAACWIHHLAKTQVQQLCTSSLPYAGMQSHFQGHHNTRARAPRPRFSAHI
jgi:hypothetical protein